jgi:trk system potassium uptake protein TrkH
VPVAPSTLRPPSLIPAVVRKRARSERALWTVCGVLVSLLVLDFAYPLHLATIACLGAVCLLLLPWSYLVLRARGSGVDSFRQTLGVRLAAIGLAIAFFAARGWVFLASSGLEPEHFKGSARSYSVALMAVLLLGPLSSGAWIPRLARQIADHPSRSLAASFAGAGLFGTFLLSLPVSMQRVSELSFIDNLFMAFSAVCITGLSVTGLSETYTDFGQLVICVLVQIGGIGIMVLSSAIAMLIGQRLRVRSRVALANVVDTHSLAGLRRTVASIVLYTLLIELVGALLLYQRFRSSELAVGSGALGMDPAVWASIFHAVSAFCNAGFSIFPQGLSPFVGDPAVLGVISVLILLGGIGFPVIDELLGRVAARIRRRRPHRLSLHSRVCLVTSAALLLILAVAYLVLEWSSAFAELSPLSRLSAAVFQSVSARTAGFQVVDLDGFRSATLLVTCAAMFVGASPGSCGGGIKTTTLAVLYAGLRAELTARDPQLFDRALPEATLRRSISVVFMSMSIVSLAILGLFLVEDHPPLELVFEAFSAFSTVGMSTGITPELSLPGKVLVTALMFAGRIGPLTLALAVASKASSPNVIRLPEERVLIG